MPYSLVYRVSNGAVWRCDQCGDTFSVLDGALIVCPECEDFEREADEWMAQLEAGLEPEGGR